MTRSARSAAISSSRVTTSAIAKAGTGVSRDEAGKETAMAVVRVVTGRGNLTGLEVLERYHWHSKEVISLPTRPVSHHHVPKKAHLEHEPHHTHQPSHRRHSPPAPSTTRERALPMATDAAAAVTWFSTICSSRVTTSDLAKSGTGGQRMRQGRGRRGPRRGDTNK